MKRHNKTRISLRRILSTMIFLTFGCFGCDQIEASRTLVESALTEIQAAEGSETSGPSDPSIESIGPEDAQRIYYQFVDRSGQVQFVERNYGRAGRVA